MICFCWVLLYKYR